MKKLLAVAMIAAAFAPIASQAALPKCGEGVQQNCAYVAKDGTTYTCQAWVQQTQQGNRVKACFTGSGLVGGIEG